MATIKPFKAIRPKSGMEEKIAALPYDVYNREEATEIVKNNSNSFLAIDRAETHFGLDVDTYDERVYQKAHDLLWNWVEREDFIKEEKECYYIYELIMDGRSQKGIVACASIDDYKNNIIKKHENTRADKELDRINHVKTCKAQTGPIFLAYRENEILKEIITRTIVNDPIYNFMSEDGIIHRCFCISCEEDIENIKAAFEAMNAIYIADGHHRCASAVKVGELRRKEDPNHTGTEEYNYFLSVLFSSEELKIMDYNRVVKDLNHLSKEEFIDKLSVKFEIEDKGQEEYHPENKGMFGMYLDKKWYKLKVKEEFKSKDPVKGLDVALLQEEVLTPLLGILDPKIDKRIDFVGGIRGLAELEKRVNLDMEVAFSLFPTSIYELFQVADIEELMPPKSTWFEPKLRSGLFIHEI